MPFNGSGVFTNPYDWVEEAGLGNEIDAAKFKSQDDGVATGLSNTITRDGQSTITASIPFNNQKITGLGDATADQDGLNRRTADDRYLQLLGGAMVAASVSASDIDCETGNWFYKTATGNLTWTFSNVPSGAFGFVLELTDGGLGTQSWPVTVDWPNGVAPTLSSSGRDILTFITRDGGIRWLGFLSGRALS
jgi:hypothetical protein